MEKGFKEIKIYHKDSQELIKYHNESKSNLELEKEKLLNILILNFYNKVFDSNISKINLDIFPFDFYGYGYNTSDGYYIIYGGLHNQYEVATFKDDINCVFIEIAEKIIERKSFDNVYNNRKMLRADYKERFGNVNYLWQIYESEYTIDKFDKYYDGSIPEELLNKYINRINIEGIIYDKNNKEIKIDKQEKRRKLQK